MLQNAYFLAKIGADTAENEQHFAEILPTDALRWCSAGAAPPGRADERVAASAWAVPMPVPVYLYTVTVYRYERYNGIFRTT